MEEDKKLYSYKEALEQPNWIRSIFRFVNFSTAVKFSRFVYCVLVSLLLFSLFKLLPFLPINYNIIFSVFIGWTIAGVLEDLKVDGRPFIFYFKDYLIYYFTYGYRADTIFINKGKVYRRLDKIEEVR